MEKTILKLTVIIVFAIWGCNNNSTGTTKLSKIDSTKTTQSNLSTNIIDLKNISFSGAEPFWSIKFEDDFAIYTTPVELEGVKVFYKKNIGDNNNLKLNDAIIKVSDKEIKVLGVMSKSSVEITVKNEKCSDGMSEGNFTYKISLLRDKKEKYEGCGNSK